MEMYPQQHDDFGWLYHATWREYEMPLFIKADLSLLAKTAVAIPQVEFVMQIATHERHRELIFFCYIAPSRIQDLNPLEYLAQIIIVCARVTDHSTTQCPRDANPKLEPGPA